MYDDNHHEKAGQYNLIIPTYSSKATPALDWRVCSTD